MTNKKVEIFSTESCHFCHMAKEFFKENGIAFTDYNVGVDTTKRAEMLDKSGQMGVPVIIIDEKDVVIGFDFREMLYQLSYLGKILRTVQETPNLLEVIQRLVKIRLQEEISYHKRDNNDGKAYESINGRSTSSTIHFV